MASYDVIVIGSGVAGLTAALALARHRRTLLLTKDALEESATRYAQGGIAAALGPGDAAAAHCADTIAAGAGLVDEGAARVLAEAAAERIAALVALGVPFDREGAALALGREAAHSAARIVHAGGDATGLHLERTLAAHVRQAPLAVREHAFVTSIVVEDGCVAGVKVLGADGGGEEQIDAPIVVLATGGAGQLYRYTTNPTVATGDGIALAYRAGAAVMDLEFIQFHPTALRLPGAPPTLITEAVRGEGAVLRDRYGHAFMATYDPRAELAPRDIVARAIWQEMARTDAECVYLDLRSIPPERLRARFPGLLTLARTYGLDPLREPIPVAPAAHYTMGGVRANLWGETTLSGLYACGEVACTGVHGANRLASNSLLEGLVFGARAAERILTRRSDEPWPSPPPDALALSEPPAPARATAAGTPPDRQALQTLMWEHVGLIRDAPGLSEARAQLAAWQTEQPVPRDRATHELANLLLVGRLVAEAALLRRESRGAHYRRDYPEPGPLGVHRFVFQRDGVPCVLAEEAACAAAD